MENKISDMMDHILDDTVDIQILDVASSEKIKEATMSKLYTKTDSNKRVHKVSRVILIAAIVALALSVSAFAYVGFVVYENPAFMLDAFFGENVESKSEGVVEYDDNGGLTAAVPGWERVPVDAALADELISKYISAETATITWDEYTLSVEANLYDSHTQSGLLYYSIENPAGVSGYVVRGQNSIIFPEDSTLPILCLSGNWTGADFIDAARSTDTKIYVCRYYIGSEGLAAESEQDLDLGTLKLQVRSNIDREVLGSAEISYTNENGLAGLTLADGNIIVSPIAVRIYDSKLGYEMVNDITSIVLNYNDGTEYVVIDNNNFTDNTTYGVLDSVSNPSRVTFTFNRIVDINSISSVTVNGTTYDVA